MLDFLYYPIAWVLKMWHLLWGAVFDPHSGASWVLSIMFLVITVRILLFPVFGLHTTLAQNLKMGAIFTVVSIARSFALRRVFEAIRMRSAK